MTVTIDKSIKFGSHESLSHTAVATEKEKPTLDEQWKKISQKSQQHLRDGKLGLYACDLYDLSEIIRKEKRYNYQLELLMMSAYIHLSGVEEFTSYQMLKDHLGMRSPILPPAVIRATGIAIRRLNMDIPAYKTLFRQVIDTTMTPTHLYGIEGTIEIICLYLNNEPKKAEEKIKIGTKEYISDKKIFPPNTTGENNIFEKRIDTKGGFCMENNEKKESIFKKKIPTWFICVLFALWFIYGIPLVVGILLLLIKNKQDEKDSKHHKDLVEEREHLISETEHYKEILTSELPEALELKQFVNSLQEEKSALSKEIEHYNEILTPEVQDAFKLEKFVNSLHEKESALSEKIQILNNNIADLEKDIDIKKAMIVTMDDEILIQEFGLYEPTFDFANSVDYKVELSSIRAEQKEMIKNKEAVTGSATWTVNNSTSKGKKMVTDIQKLLLRAFNNECDDLVSKVKYTNFDASLDKIRKSADTISKLGNSLGISITLQYIDAKIKELRLAFEYQLKKQQEKEEQKIARTEQREAAKLQIELDAQRKKIEKEQTHYQTVYEKLQHQLEEHPKDKDLLKKKSEMESKLEDIDKSLNDIDYRQANTKAGYVYVISNIGAFGENIYKIGMTRRLDPQDRVDELGDASVPFNFDVHAMIFSEDAPALEAALHRAFEDKKVNMVNQRREFFNVTLDEIKSVIRENFDKTVEFVNVPDAEQYRVSMKMRQQISN
jgi:hypothetical protein